MILGTLFLRMRAVRATPVGKFRGRKTIDNGSWNEVDENVS